MYRLTKRILDIILSFISLLILSPLLLIIIFILLITAEGEVFYFQKRVGYKNQYFYVWKFATMLKNSINMGTGSITLRDDFRVTKFGKFLRKSKINELPQLINILKGDISIIGPRPLVDQTFFLYDENIRNNIYNSKPGLSGIGSIIFRDEEKILSELKDQDPLEFYKNKISPYKGALELWYFKNRSIMLDLKLIIITMYVVVFPKSTIYKKWLPALPIRDF